MACGRTAGVAFDGRRVAVGINDAHEQAVTVVGKRVLSGSRHCVAGLQMAPLDIEAIDLAAIRRRDEKVT